MEENVPEAETPNEQLPHIERESLFHQLRMPTQHLVGRETVIEQIVQGVTQAAPNGATVVLHGRSGVGKTALAHSLAQRLTDLFPDAQLVLDLQGVGNTPLTPQRVIQQIIHTFKPQAQVHDDLTVLRERFMAIAQDKRVVILADELAASDQIQGMLPIPPGCLLIITTHEPLAIAATHNVHLQPLTESNAIALLVALAPRLATDKDEHLASLAAACGYLPLALRMAAGMLACDETLSMATLLDYLTTADYTDPCQLLCHVSYQALGTLEQATLRQISLFPTSFAMEAARTVVSLQGIAPTKPITQHRQDETATSEEKPRGRAAPPAGEHIMHQLCQRALVDYDPTIASYTMHSVVRHFATIQRKDANGGVFRRYAKYYAQIATDIESLYLQGGDQMLEGLDIFDEERTHIEASWTWAKEQGEDTLLLQFLCIVGHMGLVRYHIRNEYIPRAAETLAAARRLKRRGDECHLLNVLGSGYRALGDLPTAITYYQQALAMLRTVRKQSNEVSVLGNMGNAYLNLGEVKQAIKHYKRSLATARKRQDVRGESAALGQLGLAHAEAGDYAGALAFYEQSLTIARQHRYRDYEEEILTGLGTVYLEQGELEKAKAVCERALSIIQETGNRRDEGYALLMLGKVSAAEQAVQTDQTQTDDHYHAALSIAREIGDKRMEGRVWQAIGAWRLAQQQATQAQTALEEARTLAQSIGDRCGEAMSSWYLGLVLEQQQTPTALVQATELMQVRVAYEQAIEHPASATHQQRVQALQQAYVAPQPR